ncbi:MAG: sterol desaturase family protein [Pseudomonadaceae bacterium]|nr:sterol desaturase family protein [Pseudomonadaceae bacterium]
MAVFSFIYAFLVEPVIVQFTGIFDLNGRFGLLFLCVSYAVAYGLFRWRKRRGLTDACSFWQFIGGRQVNLHRSALLDYRYYFVRAILKVALLLPLFAWLAPYLFKPSDYVELFTRLWGARPLLTEQSLGLALLYGLGLFLLRDFSHYWVHRAFHSRLLWEFHKVHHSAPVLVPATASRVHVVELIADKLLASLGVALYAGLFWYLCGGRVSAYTLFGVTYLLFICNALAANLRHSHVWLSFGSRIEHVLSSPAQHQIHHSDAPRHFNKNFATNLSLWDWLFGTLYVTSATPEPLQFGTGERDSERYLTLYGLIVTPFVRVAGQLAAARARRAPSAPASVEPVNGTPVSALTASLVPQNASSTANLDRREAA